MKNFVFVSDFDGTLTKKDFYKILSDEYYKEEIKDMYNNWQNGEIRDVDYLGYIFKNVKRNEDEILEDIMKISLDPFTKQFIERINALGGEFVIVSAGTSYYIEKVLKMQGIGDVKIYSNRATFKNNGLHFALDEKDEFYSDIFGIDKEKVVKKLRSKYSKVFYAGDSRPDVKAALEADLVFAKGKLVNLLKEKGKAFIEFNNFSEIIEKVEDYLRE